MNLIALPAFTDNYVWMLHDGRHALVVDPGDAGPVQAALDRDDLELAAILVTHHHPDHVGGIEALSGRCRGPVVGPAAEAIPCRTSAVGEGDALTLLGLSVQVLEVPGHTAGHVAFLLPDVDGAPVLFCGDTLFSAGCGRLFEGTPAQMHHSLSRLAALPAATRVCCAHEYTLSNLRFAAAVEPGNPAVTARQRHGESMRAQGLPTLPSTIAVERDINPFLRCEQPDVVAAARGQGAASDDPVDVLAALRTWKNQFR